MGVAYELLDGGDVRLGRELLEAQQPTGRQPDFRGFEWRYLSGLYRTQEVHTFTDAGGCGG